MASIPVDVPTSHLDEDIDSVFQARVQLKATTDTLNIVMEYLRNLFGWEGDKQTAITTLFSNQAVLFPSGTRMYFMQASPPPGWYQMPFDTGRYLMAVPGNTGGQPIGAFEVNLPTTETVLAQGHLPAVSLFGATDFQGDHAHGYTHTEITYTGGVVSFERDANGPKAWARYDAATTGTDGNHRHNFSVHTGGAGWGHNHYVNMSSYRPTGWQGIIGIKI